MKLQTIPLTAEREAEILAARGYTCRHRPNLRVRTEECQSRKELARRPSTHPDLSPYFKCRDCEGPMKIEQAMEIAKPDTPKYVCPKHGAHSGAMVAGKRVKSCPECTKDKRDRAFKATLNQRLTIVFDECSWLYAWLEHSAKSSKLTIEQYMLKEMAGKVPADFIKNYALKTAGLE